MTYDKPIEIQVRDEKAKLWVPYQKLHAYINTTSSDQRTTSGVSQSEYSLTFIVRFNPGLADVAQAMQKFRIVYAGNFYRIASCDDYMQQHKTVKVVGVSYG